MNKEKKSTPLNSHKKGLILALLLALFIHTLFLSIALYSNFFQSTDKVPQANTAKLRLASAEEIKKYKQVVGLSGKNSSKPKQADFLAERNQSVEKQTLRRLTKVSKAAAVAPSRIAEPKPAKRSKLPLLFPSSSEIQNALTKYAENTQNQVSNEYASNIPTDAQSRLNTWEFKHSAFFLRVKEAIARYWNPQPVLAQKDPLQKLYSRDQVTVLQVTIDKQGQLQDIQVLEKSRADFIDQEAVLAMQKAAPFSQPPMQLFEGKSLFTFQMGFHIHFENFSFDFSL